jgi:hypothetical protein
MSCDRTAANHVQAGTAFAALAYKDNITIETLRAFLLMPHATMSNVPLSDTDAQDIAAFIIAMKK